MTLVLSNYVSGGELVNSRRNSVHGYLALHGCDRPVVLQLTGNFTGELAGRHIHFEVSEQRLTQATAVTEQQMTDMRLAWMQIGVPGTISVTASSQSSNPAGAYSGFYLEWFGQNGRIVIELVDPLIEFVSPDDLASEADLADDDLEFDADDLDLDPDNPLGWEDSSLEEDLNAAEFSENSESPQENLTSFDPSSDDPFGLFPNDLSASLEASTSPWEADVDEETLAMWKEWDEVIDGTKDVPLSTLFDPPMKMPAVDSLNDEQVIDQLNTILKQLALHNIAFHMCEHFSPRAAYKLMLEQILPEQGSHPELPRIGYTMNLDTSEFCDECAAEFERRDAERNSERHRRPDSDENPDDNPF